jgi:hypothetical protein
LEAFAHLLWLPDCPSDAKEPTMRYQIGELGLGGILDQAVTLTKNHFGLLFGVTAVLQIPFGLVQGFVELLIAPQMPADPTPQEVEAFLQTATANLWITSPITLVGVLFVIPITNAAIIHAIAKAYLEKPTTVGESIRRAFSILLPLIWTWILLYLAVLGGTMLFIIPGILCLFWFALATQVVVVEGISGFAALKRSKALMKGNIGTLFVLGLLIGAINLGIYFAAGFIPQQHVRLVGAVVAQAIATIFGAAAVVVFYFSCRCEHEHFDLILLAQSVGVEPSDTVADDGALEA